MATREERLTSEVVLWLSQKMRDEKLGLYPAMRIVGYSLVALAESLDLEGEADDQE